MENKQTMIEVQNLCKSFHKLEVLKDISTTFYKNEVVSIIGPSGGGKSTFLRCLNLLEKPTSGHIVFDGVDICDRHQNKNIDLHRQKMGMVFQQFNLFNNMNVMKNLTVAPMRIKKMPKELPVYFFGGDSDPVGSLGSGIPSQLLLMLPYLMTVAALIFGSKKAEFPSAYTIPYSRMER